MNCKTKLQVRIDDYAYGVWFDTTDIDPYANTVRIHDHLFEKERSFVDDGSFQYREVKNWNEILSSDEGGDL